MKTLLILSLAFFALSGRSWAQDDPGDPCCKSEIEWCSDYVGRPLKLGDWIGDKDVAEALSRDREGIKDVLEMCSEVMPRKLQIKWAKEHLRRLYGAKKKYPGDPWYREQCARTLGIALKPTLWLSDHEFQFLLRAANANISTHNCFNAIAPHQLERWLEREAAYVIDVSIPARRNKPRIHHGVIMVQ